MKLPDYMLLLEPLHCTAEEIMQQGACNPTAVQNYISCLSRGWLGQALIERYSHTQVPSTPAGMNQTNAIRDEIKNDLRDLLKGGYTEDLVIERDIYAKAIELHRDDPGRELLGELVEMIDQGLQEMPKIYVTVKNTHGEEVVPTIEVKWCNGMEETITRLSGKVLEDSIVGMDIRKSGHDFHVTYQANNAESALDLVEEIEEWC